MEDVDRIGLRYGRRSKSHTETAETGVVRSSSFDPGDLATHGFEQAGSVEW